MPRIQISHSAISAPLREIFLIGHCMDGQNYRALAVGVQPLALFLQHGSGIVKLDSFRFMTTESQEWQR